MERRESSETLVNFDYEPPLLQKPVRRSTYIVGITAISFTLISVGTIETALMYHNWTAEGEGRQPPFEIFMSSRLLSAGYLTMGLMMMLTCLPLACCKQYAEQ
jgi:hypothetical protein